MFRLCRQAGKQVVHLRGGLLTTWLFFPTDDHCSSISISERVAVGRMVVPMGRTAFFRSQRTMAGRRGRGGQPSEPPLPLIIWCHYPFHCDRCARVLNESGYARYDERTASMLGDPRTTRVGVTAMGA
jgi:hypothetical protein